jgi:hypothetical protein
MYRTAFVFLTAAVTGLSSLPASAQSYCAAVVPNEQVLALKRNMLNALIESGAAGGVGKWPGSTTGMLEVGADQGTMLLVEDMWHTGLALHATLCANATACGDAIRFFSKAGSNNYLKRYGDSNTDFAYVDLKTSYEELLKNRPFTLRTGTFQPQDWGTWYALSLGGALRGYTQTTREKKTQVDVTGALHVAFIKVKYASKDSTNAQAFSNAIRTVMEGTEEIQLTFTEVRCR